MEQLLTVEQAATRLHVHPKTVRRHLNAGTLRGIKRGNLWRVPESALTEETPAAPITTGETGSAFERALALVAQLEEEMKDAPQRVAGVNDVVSELRAVREAQTP